MPALASSTTPTTIGTRPSAATASPMPRAVPSRSNASTMPTAQKRDSDREEPSTAACHLAFGSRGHAMQPSRRERTEHVRLGFWRRAGAEVREPGLMGREIGGAVAPPIQPGAPPPGGRRAGLGLGAVLVVGLAAAGLGKAAADHVADGQDRHVQPRLLAPGRRRRTRRRSRRRSGRRRRDDEGDDLGRLEGGLRLGRQATNGVPLGWPLRPTLSVRSKCELRSYGTPENCG